MTEFERKKRYLKGRFIMYKRIVAFLLVLLVVFVFSACGGKAAETSPTPEPEATPVESKPSFDLDAYKETVTDLREKTMDNSLYLYNIAKYLNKFIEAHASIDGSTALKEETIEKGYDWLLEKADVKREDIVSTNDAIKELYKSLILTEIEGKEAEELDKLVRDMFDAYSGLYDLVNTPTDTSSHFASDCNQFTGTLNDVDEKLGILLD